MSFHTINPSNGQIISNYRFHDRAAVTLMIQHAETAFNHWQHTTHAERRMHLTHLAQLIEKNTSMLAKLITTEMGKPIAQAQTEVSKCINLCRHYAKFAETDLQTETIPTEYAHSFVSYEALGIIVSIKPWNYPLWSPLCSIIPAIAAGNVSLLKPALNTVGVGLAIEQLFLDAGFPRHVMQTLVIEDAHVAEVIDQAAVAAVAFTGSVRVGRIIAAEAGQALKKTVLELGGNDPYLVLADADVTYAAQRIVKARASNCGQTCIAPKRIIVHQSIVNTFLQAVEEAFAGYRFGDPLDPQTNLGPMARADLRQTVHQQVQRTIDAGATLRQGAYLPHGAAYYYPLTLLDGVTPGMPAFEEEVFGPVISIIHARDEAEAIMLANSTGFGLGSAVFTQDEQRGFAIAHQLKAGNCWINGNVTTDPRLPFGGHRQSGYGRLLGTHGIREYTNIKTICSM
jgi:succinate-semialdehyde dehydrogenase/glutarate-semialdehyde dehydrogenase